MTPKEKAERLFEKYNNVDIQPFALYGEYMSKEASKQCILIAVDEIIETLNKEVYPRFQYDDTFKYWQEVKQEIEAL